MKNAALITVTVKTKGEWIVACEGHDEDAMLSAARSWAQRGYRVQVFQHNQQRFVASF